MFPHLKTVLQLCAQCQRKMFQSTVKYSTFQTTCYQRLLKHYYENIFARQIFKIQKFSSGYSLQKEESSKADDVEVSIEKNPYFIKYKNQLQQLKSMSPELYEEKLKLLKQQLKPKASQESVKETETEKTATDKNKRMIKTGRMKPKTLDGVMKIELVKDKSAEEIEQLWKEYHKKKDCVYAVLKDDDYWDLITKAELAPMFAYPLPRDNGYEFMLSQIDGNEVYFTSLALYQKLKESAQPCLTLTHYTEFLKDKGIVLMNGHYDSNILKLHEALSLVNQMTLYYGRGAVKFNLVRQFNLTPESFNYQDLIENLQNIQLMKS